MVRTLSPMNPLSVKYSQDIHALMGGNYWSGKTQENLPDGSPTPILSQNNKPQEGQTKRRGLTMETGMPPLMISLTTSP